MNHTHNTLGNRKSLEKVGQDGRNSQSNLVRAQGGQTIQGQGGHSVMSNYQSTIGASATNNNMMIQEDMNLSLDAE